MVPGCRLLRLAGRIVLGVALTTLVAGLATAPFAAYHFERVASYSLLGNLLAAPLVSGIIMPFGLLSLVAMPFGLEALPLAVMARGIDMLLAVAAWVASLPGAEVRAPDIAPLSLLLIVAGMLWLCLWRLRGGFSACRRSPSGSSRSRSCSIRRTSSSRRTARPSRCAIPAACSASPAPAPAPMWSSSSSTRRARRRTPRRCKAGVRCDALACILGGAGGLEVSHVLDPAAFAEDCGRASVVVDAA